MANNSVPLGEAGTGAAYVLPESKALKGLLDNIDYNRKMGLLNVKARSDYNTQLNKDFADNQLKAKSGILFQDELNKLSQDWVNKGVQLRTQGINPFNPNVNDPNQVKIAGDYVRQKALIEGMANTRDLYQKNFLDQQGEYQKGGYDEDSWHAFNDFYNKHSLQDLYAGGITPPTLQKAFDSAAFMKGVHAPTIKSNKIANGVETTILAPNEGAIRTSIESGIANNPQAQRFYNKQFQVDPAATPAKMLIGSSDPKEVSTYLDQYYKTTPEGVAAAVKAFPAGTVPSYNSPEYANFLQDSAAKQVQAESKYQSGIDSLVKAKAAEANSENIKKYNFDLENQGMKREDQSMQRTRFGWDATNQANKIEDRKLKDETANTRDKFIQGLQVGNKEEVMNLRQLAKAKGGAVSFSPDGVMHVGWKEKYYGQIVPKKQEIDLSEANQYGYVQLNELLNTLAGKKIPLETLQAKPTYDGGLVNIGDVSLNKDQIQYLRSKFNNDYQSLGDMLKSQGQFKTTKEAYEAAAEILDAKGRIHKNVQK